MDMNNLALNDTPNTLLRNEAFAIGNNCSSYAGVSVYYLPSANIHEVIDTTAGPQDRTVTFADERGFC